MMKSIARLVFAGALLMSLGLAHQCGVNAEVNININIGPPPVYVIPAPPEVVVIPRTYAYYVPNIEVDIIFYQGYWYRPHKEYWYRSMDYNGPWVYIVREKIPIVILNLPPDYRHIPPGHTHIPYGQLKKEWKNWEKGKYWDKDNHHEKEWKKEHHKGKGKHGGHD